jgi:hypothetical protein
MKKIISISLLTCLIALGISFTAYGRSEDFAFHHNGNLTEKTKRIFNVLGIKIETLAQANEFAQKNLLRKGERWDAQDETQVNKAIRENQSMLINDLRSLNMIDAVEPKHKSYTYALLMGALKATVEVRLAYLQELLQNGHSFDSVVLLGGARELRDIEKEGLPEGINTEAQMMAYLCAQSASLADKNVILVDAPMIQKADGTFTRPTTDSTLVHFAQIAPQDGSCLVISNNPYIVRQTKVTQRILDQSRFPTEGAGPAVNIERTGILMVMDEFARTLYEDTLQYSAHAKP